jgi:hypothetical protein
MAYDVSIEVFDGEFAASSWSAAHGDDVIGAAVWCGARSWRWHQLPWGVVLELSFDDEAQWDELRDSLALRTALDAVPDPVSGVLVYRGFGGSGASGVPRRPRPLAGSGAAALPLPVELFDLDLLVDDVARQASRVLLPV